MALDLTGEYTLPLPRSAVWSALNDPAVLQRCVPGCETFDRLSDTEFAVVTQLAIGPVKARFKGKLRLEDINPLNGCTIVGAGEGGLAGFAKGSATVALIDFAEGTQLTYRAQAQIGGKLAQLGQRLIAGTTRKLADLFFAKFIAALSPNQETAPRVEIADDRAAMPSGNSV
jgi:carbon monoxide dehydrogenase subunit G